MKRIILIVLMSLILIGCAPRDEVVTGSSPKYHIVGLDGREIVVEYKNRCYPSPSNGSIYVRCYEENTLHPDHIYIAIEFWKETPDE